MTSRGAWAFRSASHRRSICAFTNITLASGICDTFAGDAFANRAVLYDHKGEKDLAIADYRAALAKNPSPEDRKDLEAALKRLGAAP